MFAFLVVAGRKDIPRWGLLVGKQVEPPPLRLIPGDREGLEAPAGNSTRYCWSVAPRRTCSESESRRVFLFGPSVLTKKPSPRLKKSEAHTAGERPVREISEHALRRRRGHGLGMVRSLPLSALLQMTAEADLVIDVSRLRRGRRRCGLGISRTLIRLPGQGADEDHHDSGRSVPGDRQTASRATH